MVVVVAAEVTRPSSSMDSIDDGLVVVVVRPSM